MTIINYTPQNDKDTLYIPHNTDLEELIQKVKEHFGEDVEFSKVCVTPENIHTHCLTYDLHDPSDYTDYLVITLM